MTNIKKMLQEKFSKIFEECGCGHEQEPSAQKQGDELEISLEENDDNSDYAKGWKAGHAVGSGKVNRQEYEEGFEHGVMAGAQASTMSKHSMDEDETLFRKKRAHIRESDKDWGAKKIDNKYKWIVCEKCGKYKKHEG